MDDKTFSKELHILNQRVAAMSASNNEESSNPYRSELEIGNPALQDYHNQLWLLEQQNKKRLLAARQEQDEEFIAEQERKAQQTESFPEHDEFFSQLADLKAHMASLQDSVDQQRAKSNISGAFLTKDAVQQPSPNHDLTIAPQTNFALPSGPLFWQLFSTLRTDVQSLDSRMAAVEHGLSDLEDRFDDIKAEQLTPAESVVDPDESDPYFPQDVFCADVGSPVAQRSDAMTASVANGKMLAGFNDSTLGSSLGTNEGQLFATRGSDMDVYGSSFRDREITRLDELLKIATDKLEKSERNVAERDETISNMKSSNTSTDKRFGHIAASLIQKQRDLSDTSRRLSRKEAVIEQLSSELAARDHAIDSWKSRCYDLEDRVDQHRADLDHADARLAAWQNYAQDCSDRRHDEVGARDEMIRRLQEFCEQKDAIGSRQEEVLARGAHLMYERDEEIEKLTRKLKKAEDEIDYRSQQKSHMMRHLQQRGDEVFALKREIRGACEKPKTARNPEEERQELVNRLNYILQIAEGKPNPRMRDLGSSRDSEVSQSQASRSRAVIDESRPPLPQRPRPSDDKPDKKSRRSGHDYEYTGEPRGNGAERSSFNEDDMARAASLQTERESERGGNEQRQSRRVRHQLPPQSPPMPKQSSVSRAQSMAELKNPVRDAGNKTVSKHRSMGDLGRRKLQPYVETDNEAEVGMKSTRDAEE